MSTTILPASRPAFRHVDEEFTEAHALACLEHAPTWADEDESDLGADATDTDGTTTARWCSAAVTIGDTRAMLCREDRYQLTGSRMTPGAVFVTVWVGDNDALRVDTPGAARDAAAALAQVADVLSTTEESAD